MWVGGGGGGSGVVVVVRGSDTGVVGEFGGKSDVDGVNDSAGDEAAPGSSVGVAGEEVECECIWTISLLCVIDSSILDSSSTALWRSASTASVSGSAGASVGDGGGVPAPTR